MWVKKDTWLPEPEPWVIVAPRDEWDDIGREVNNKKPFSPIHLIVPGTMIHGARILGYIITHQAAKELRPPERLDQFTDHLRCHIIPSTVKPPDLNLGVFAVEYWLTMYPDDDPTFI